MLAIPTARIALAAILLAGAAWTVTPPLGEARTSPGVPPQRQIDGAALAAELGCGGCHEGVTDASLARSRAPIFGEGGDPLPADFVFAYLEAPEPRRTDIGATRMPDFGLDEAERVALALFLGTDAPGGDLAAAAVRHPTADATTGEIIFRTLGCVGCHQHSSVPSGRVGPDLSREGGRILPQWLRSYLVAPQAIRGDGHPMHPGARMPDFRLSDTEVDALTEYLVGLGPSGSWSPDPLTPFGMRRTETLVKERLACLGCHTLDGEGGRIGPTLDGVGRRLKPAFIRDLVADPAGTHPGSGMPRHELAARDADVIAAYLLQRGRGWTGWSYASLADPAHPAQTALAGADAPPGEALYRRHCAACHGVQGRGDGFNAPRLPVPPTAHADPLLMGRRPDDTLFDGIHAGAWVLDGSNRMPPFGELLSAEEIRLLVGYIRRLCDCEAPAWARDGRAR